MLLGFLGGGRFPEIWGTTNTEGIDLGSKSEVKSEGGTA